MAFYFSTLPRTRSYMGINIIRGPNTNDKAGENRVIME